MQTQTRVGDWFQTHNGVRFHPLDARLEEINIDDIAHALARVCRFGGHTEEFYSVAQHSVIVSNIVPKGLELCGLLHDATEAYIGDVVRPLKYQMPQYREIEDRLWLVIAERFNLPTEIPKEVKDADNVALITERRDLLQHQQTWGEWTKAYTPLEKIIQPLCPKSAEMYFTMRFNALMGI
jgi:5'-deoxynucleotidase YfbR-like HD superfamily hydrolase